MWYFLPPHGIAKIDKNLIKQTYFNLLRQNKHLYEFNISKTLREMGTNQHDFQIYIISDYP